MISKKRKLAVGLFLVAAIAEEEERLKRRANQQRRMYVRPALRLRDTHGVFATVVTTIRNLNDVKWKKEYFRMSDESFDELLRLVRPYLIKKPTHLNPITPELRLVYTI